MERGTTLEISDAGEARCAVEGALERERRETLGVVVVVSRSIGCGGGENSGTQATGRPTARAATTAWRVIESVGLQRMTPATVCWMRERTSAAVSEEMTAIEPGGIGADSIGERFAVTSSRSPSRVCGGNLGEEERGRGGERTMGGPEAHPGVSDRLIDRGRCGCRGGGR